MKIHLNVLQQRQIIVKFDEEENRAQKLFHNPCAESEDELNELPSVEYLAD